MNKPISIALLALTLAACDQSGPVSIEPTASELQSGPSVAHTTPEERNAKVDAARKTMPAATNIEPQTDKAIDVMLGDHAAYHKAINDFQKAVAAHDTDGVAAMVRYPMTVEVDGQKVVIESAGRFKQFYGKLIPPETAKVIVDSQYSDVMINRKGVLLGDGQTMMSGNCIDADCKKMEVKIATIQPPKASN